jgi:ammonia channel protein AmtB
MKDIILFHMYVSTNSDIEEDKDSSSDDISSRCNYHNPDQKWESSRELLCEIQSDNFCFVYTGVVRSSNAMTTIDQNFLDFMIHLHSVALMVLGVGLSASSKLVLISNCVIISVSSFYTLMNL